MTCLEVGAAIMFFGLVLYIIGSAYEKYREDEQKEK